MAIITDEMQRLILEQRLGFIATVCPDGTPNLSPKGTTAVFDDDCLFFADIISPNTVANLRHNPAIEINVVDPFVRKGYRFKGTADIHEGGEAYRRGQHRHGQTHRARHRRACTAAALARLLHRCQRGRSPGALGTPFRRAARRSRGRRLLKPRPVLWQAAASATGHGRGESSGVIAAHWRRRGTVRQAPSLSRGARSH